MEVRKSSAVREQIRDATKIIISHKIRIYVQMYRDGQNYNSYFDFGDELNIRDNL